MLMLQVTPLILTLVNWLTALFEEMSAMQPFLERKNPAEKRRQMV